MAPWVLYVAIGRADAIELASKWSTAKAVRYHAESHIETPKSVETEADRPGHQVPAASG